MIRELTDIELKEQFKLLDSDRINKILSLNKEGYKNEKCLKCNKIFLADIHFIKCNEKQCPMKSDESILDILLND